MITKIFKTTVLNSVFGWKKPRHLILHVTSRCNARCGMCFAWRRLNKDNDLTFGEIGKIAKILNNLIFLDISGGEPFLRDDLDKVLAIFGKESPGVYVNLPTNCLLPEKVERKTREILQKTNLPISFNLSLDGPGEVHDKIRGVKGCFDKVLQTYQRLTKIKRENKRLSLKVATVVSQENFKQLAELASFVKLKMPEIDFHTLILVRGEPPDKHFVLPDLGQLEQGKSLFFKIWQSFGYGKNLGFLGSKIANVSHRYLFTLYLKTLREKKMVLPCLAGRAQAVIFANGDLALCELREPIGNLKEVDFDFWRLWHSQEAQKQRREINRNLCFCTNGCNWTDNVFFNLKNYPALTQELIRSFC